MHAVNLYKITSGRCRSSSASCEHTECRYHMDSDSGAGSNESSITPKVRHEACVLDAAEVGPLTLKEIGERIGRTRELVRQIELRAFRKLRRVAPELQEVFIAAMASLPAGPVYPNGSEFERSIRRRVRNCPTR